MMVDKWIKIPVSEWVLVLKSMWRGQQKEVNVEREVGADWWLKESRYLHRFSISCLGAYTLSEGVIRLLFHKFHW